MSDELETVRRNGDALGYAVGSVARAFAELGRAYNAGLKRAATEVRQPPIPEVVEARRVLAYRRRIEAERKIGRIEVDRLLAGLRRDVGLGERR